MTPTLTARTPDEILAEIAAGTARRNYILSHEAWYAGSRLRIGSETGREITVGIEALTDGRHDGCIAEFLITEHDFAGQGGLHRPCWRVAAFDDAWTMFAIEPEFFEELARLGETAAIEQIVATLDRLGYTDRTERKDPYR